MAWRWSTQTKAAGPGRKLCVRTATVTSLERRATLAAIAPQFEEHLGGQT